MHLINLTFEEDIVNKKQEGVRVQRADEFLGPLLHFFSREVVDLLLVFFCISKVNHVGLHIIYALRVPQKHRGDLPVAIDKEDVPVPQMSLPIRLAQHLDDTLEPLVDVPHPDDFEVKSKALQEVSEC